MSPPTETIYALRKEIEWRVERDAKMKQELVELRTEIQKLRKVFLGVVSFMSMLHKDSGGILGEIWEIISKPALEEKKKRQEVRANEGLLQHE